MEKNDFKDKNKKTKDIKDKFYEKKSKNSF